MKLKHLKKTAYCALLGASVAVGAVTAKVTPTPPKLPGLITYYSNSSLTQDVGQEIVMCSGASYVSWGYITQYKTQEFFYCPPPIPE
ncbi:MAG: hypothetical protein IT473_02495 [Lysobacter sp.]|nr:hypothetical protein [Lysobacter sp.]